MEYRAGDTLPQIAKCWGISRETARLALTRAGEPVRECDTLSPSMPKKHYVFRTRDGR